MTRLQRPDKIDPMYRHPLTLLQRLFRSARLFHCKFCRIQFHDRRPLLEDLPKGIGATVELRA